MLGTLGKVFCSVPTFSLIHLSRWRNKIRSRILCRRILPRKVRVCSAFWTIPRLPPPPPPPLFFFHFSRRPIFYSLLKASAWAPTHLLCKDLLGFCPVPFSDGGWACVDLSGPTSCRGPSCCWRRGRGGESGNPWTAVLDFAEGKPSKLWNVGEAANDGCATSMSISHNLCAPITWVFHIFWGGFQWSLCSYTYIIYTSWGKEDNRKNNKHEQLWWIIDESITRQNMLQKNPMINEGK